MVGSRADRVVIGLSHADDDPESVVVAYLMAVEALRVGKQVLMWLTKAGVHLGIEGVPSTLDLPGGPSIGELHDEFVLRGGQLYACPVCVKLRDLDDGDWIRHAEIKGSDAVYRFIDDGATVFSY